MHAFDDLTLAAYRSTAASGAARCFSEPVLGVGGEWAVQVKTEVRGRRRTRRDLVTGASRGAIEPGRGAPLRMNTKTMVKLQRVERRYPLAKQKFFYVLRNIAIDIEDCGLTKR